MDGTHETHEYKSDGLKRNFIILREREYCIIAANLYYRKHDSVRTISWLLDKLCTLEHNQLIFSSLCTVEEKKMNLRVRTLGLIPWNLRHLEADLIDPWLGPLDEGICEQSADRLWLQQVNLGFYRYFNNRYILFLFSWIVACAF